MLIHECISADALRHHSPLFSSRIQRAAAFRYEKEIDCFRLNEERRRRGGVRANERRSVVQIELTGTRDVEMTRGLKLGGIQRKTVQI